MNTPVFSPRSVMPTAGKSPCIVCCTSTQDDWRWLSQELDHKPRQWHFLDTAPHSLVERLIRFPNLALIRASWQAIQRVKRHRADLLITGHPAITFWCALFIQAQGLQVEHVARSFYVPRLPSEIRYFFAQWAYASVSRFIVHSRAERQFYSEYFAIPSGRFEMQHWSCEVAPVRHTPPLEPGEYICAVSYHPQDYRSLMMAMASLPHIPLVLVMPRGRTIAAKVPPNVTIRAGLSPTARLNILQHSRLLVLPTRHSRRACDYVTLVKAMHLGKAIVTPDFPNVSDYAFQNSNAMLYEPANPESLASVIQSLWTNVVKCEILGENGREFATTFCAKASVRKFFQKLLIRYGL